MDIEQISADVGISRRKVKAMLAWLRLHKYLPPADRIDELTKIRECLGRGHVMSLGQFVTLIDKPDLIKALGAKATDARRQIAQMDGPQDDPAPALMGVQALACANRDKDAIREFGQWVRDIIPPEGCTYHYLALRIYYGIHPNLRPSVIRRMQFAMLVLRGSDDMEGWFTVRDNKGRSETFYHRPKISL